MRSKDFYPYIKKFSSFDHIPGNSVVTSGAAVVVVGFGFGFSVTPVKSLHSYSLLSFRRSICKLKNLVRNKLLTVKLHHNVYFFGQYIKCKFLYNFIYKKTLYVKYIKWAM